MNWRKWQGGHKKFRGKVEKCPIHILFQWEKKRKNAGFLQEKVIISKTLTGGLQDAILSKNFIYVEVYTGFLQENLYFIFSNKK